MPCINAFICTFYGTSRETAHSKSHRCDANYSTQLHNNLLMRNRMRPTKVQTIQEQIVCAHRRPDPFRSRCGEILKRNFKNVFAARPTMSIIPIERGAIAWAKSSKIAKHKWRTFSNINRGKDNSVCRNTDGRYLNLKYLFALLCGGL